MALCLDDTPHLHGCRPGSETTGTYTAIQEDKTGHNKDIQLPECTAKSSITGNLQGELPSTILPLTLV